jgi:hypothetical protein
MHFCAPQRETRRGGSFENVFLSAFTTTGNSIRSSNSFDLIDADRALAWFAEQTSTQGT